MTTLDSIKAQIDQISALAYHHADPEDCDAAKAALLSEIEELFSQLEVQVCSAESLQADKVIALHEASNENKTGAVWCATTIDEGLWAARPTLPRLQSEQVPESRTLYECRGCGHLHGEKVSSCDCLENGANEYNEWTASPAVAKGQA